MTTLKLQPCPFCGGASHLDHPTDPRLMKLTFVLCDSCGAVTSFRPNKTGTDVIRAYNARAKDAVP